MNIIFNKFSIFLIILLNSFVFTKNLTLHDFDNPSASHILDSHVLGDLLIVSGMLGGIEFYDISNPQILNHLDNLTLSSGGGGGGACLPLGEVERELGQLVEDGALARAVARELRLFVSAAA